MTALTKSRNAPQGLGAVFNYACAAAVLFWKNALVGLDTSGNATPATADSTLTIVGVADQYVNNTLGVAGAARVEVRTGIFGFANSAAADAITAAHVGRVVFAVDDQTVALTDAGGTRPRVGAVRFLEGGVVFVEVGKPGLGANASKTRYTLTVRAESLIGADATVYRIVAPISGRLIRVNSVLDAPLATGNATLTTKIDGVSVTSTPTPLTITQAGSAAGDVDTVTVTALNAVAEGAVISVTVGGPNTADVGANITFLIET